MAPTTTPGWYPNPDNFSTQRWWDGTAWTDQTRPTPTPAGVVATKPDNNLVWAILVTLFCCLPFGIAAIVSAAKVDGLWAAGDHAGAVRASEQAKKWSMWGAAASAAVMVAYFGFWFLLLSSATTAP